MIVGRECMSLMVCVFNVWVAVRNAVAKNTVMNARLDTSMVEFVLIFVLLTLWLLLWMGRMFVGNVHQGVWNAIQLRTALHVEVIICWRMEHAKRKKHAKLESIWMSMGFARTVLPRVLCAFPKIFVLYAKLQNIYMNSSAWILALLVNLHKIKQLMELWIELASHVYPHVWLAMEWIANLV